MPRLSEVQRGQIIEILMQGQLQNQVARHFGVNVSTIERLVRRLRETGRLADRPRSGRPRLTSRRQDRYTVVSHMRNRSLTAVECALNIGGNHGRPINSKTVRNRLRRLGIRARRPYVDPHLTPARRQRRMALVAAHAPQRFPLRQWRQVFFIYESRFSLYLFDGWQRVYRRNGERFADTCVVERDRFGGGSVMVWGGNSHGLKSQLVVIDGNLTAARYRDGILRPHVIPFLQQHNLTLQQDNTRLHVASICQVFLTINNVQPLDWPPYSPDLPPTEPIHATRAQLTRALEEEWNNIPIRRINALMNSVTRRIRAVTRANGGHTKVSRDHG